MSAMVSQINSISMVCSTGCSGAVQRKHQSSTSLAFVRGIHRWPVNSPHKGPVTGKILVWVGMRVGIGWWVGMGCKKVPTILLPQRQWSVKNPRMGLLPDTQTCVLRMRRECRERFPRPLAQRKPLVSDPYMHHGTCVMHVPWCMSGLLTRGDGENVPGIPGTFATCNCTYLVRGPWGQMNLMSSLISFNVAKQKPPCADIDLICWFVFFCVIILCPFGHYSACV